VTEILRVKLWKKFVFSARFHVFSVYFISTMCRPVLFSILADGLMTIIYNTRIQSHRSNCRADILRQTWSAVKHVKRFYDVPCLMHSSEETPQSIETSLHQLAETAVLCISGQFGRVRNPVIWQFRWPQSKEVKKMRSFFSIRVSTSATAVVLWFTFHKRSTDAWTRRFIQLFRHQNNLKMSLSVKT
jgi:hypothetical protein